MSLILIFHNNTEQDKIVQTLNNIDNSSYGNIILKIVEQETDILNFYNFQNTLSIKSIDLVNSLKEIIETKNILVNFDIVKDCDLKILNELNISLSNIFIDLYVDNNQDKILPLPKYNRIDLNIINSNKDVSSFYNENNIEFTNVDTYYENPEEYFKNLKTEDNDKSFSEYVINSFSTSIILESNSDVNFKLYTFSKNRFNLIKLNVKLNDDNLLNVKKYILKNTAKGFCAECKNKLSCIQSENFIYFSKLSKCPLFSNI